MSTNMFHKVHLLCLLVPNEFKVLPDGSPFNVKLYLVVSYAPYTLADGFLKLMSIYILIILKYECLPSWEFALVLAKSK